MFNTNQLLLNNLNLHFINFEQLLNELELEFKHDDYEEVNECFSEVYNSLNSVQHINDSLKEINLDNKILLKEYEKLSVYTFIKFVTKKFNKSESEFNNLVNETLNM